MENNSDDPFDGFGFAIRTFWFDDENLRAFRSWGQELTSEEYESAIAKSVHGTGNSEDSVRIIGTNIRTNEFSLSINSDETALKNWKYSSSNEAVLMKINYRERQNNNVYRRYELIKASVMKNHPLLF